MHVCKKTLTQRRATQCEKSSLTLLSVHGKHSHACPFLLALLLSLRLWDRALKAVTVTAHLRYRQQQITLTS